MSSVTATALRGLDEAHDAPGGLARVAVRLAVVVVGALGVTLLYWILTVTAACAATGDSPAGDQATSVAGPAGETTTSAGAATVSPAAPADDANPQPPVSQPAPQPPVSQPAPQPPVQPAPVEQPPAQQAPAPGAPAGQATVTATPGQDAPPAQTQAPIGQAPQTNPQTDTQTIPPSSTEGAVPGVDPAEAAPHAAVVGSTNPVGAIAAGVTRTMLAVTGGGDGSAPASSVATAPAGTYGGPTTAPTGTPASTRRPLVPSVIDGVLALLDQTVQTTTATARELTDRLTALARGPIADRLGLARLLAGLDGTTDTALDHLDGVSPQLQKTVDTVLGQSPYVPAGASAVPSSDAVAPVQGHLGVGPAAVQHLPGAAVRGTAVLGAPHVVSLAAPRALTGSMAGGHVATDTASTSYDAQVPADASGQAGGGSPAGAAGGASGGIAGDLTSNQLPGTSGLTTIRSDVFTMPGSPNFLPGHSPD
ncbi:MAG: hypothetical protein FWE71_00010 [Nocardioidaceae bacterium]|nr:hypothetical protein [Nocardioidaceae bacterium]MCL2612747.1 hypothetical protein [Nocardioidaceae bacterium]